MSHNFCYVDFFSHGFPSVVGRDLLTLKDFTSNEIGYLLWSAADLKERIKTSKEVGKTFNIILIRAATIHFLCNRYISRYKCHDTIHDTIHHNIQLTSDVMLLNSFGIFNFH